MDEAHRFSPRPTARQWPGTASRGRFRLRAPAVRCRPDSPVPRVVLEYTAARHEWPFGQRHQMSLWLPVVTSCGVRGVFFSTSHSACEQRKLLHQAALFRRNLAPCAVGATCALATGVDHRLPRVTASGVSGKFCSISHWAIKVVFPCSVQNARNVRRIVSHPLTKKAPFQQSRTEQ